MTIDKAKTIVGTPYYLSPEIVQNKPYSFKSDIWSLGVLLYEMCALKMPFDAQSLPLLSLKIIRCSYNPLPSIFSKDIKQIINQMLNVDSNKRPTIYDVLSNFPY
jgi:NIMA (never in mitosis gene a)-related kinase